MNESNPYYKFFSSLAATVGAAIVAVLSNDGVADAKEVVGVVILALGAVAVLGAGNLPAGVWAYMKGYVAAATAAATLFLTFLGDGGWVTPTGAQWLQLALAAAGAVGVYALPGPRVEPSTARHAA